MENIGALSVLTAFCLAVFAVIAAIAGKYGRRPFLVVSAERAVYAIWLLLTIAAAVLVSSLIKGDYRMAYVASHSNRAMPLVYKFAAWWGGQEGSLLFWSWILSCYSAVVVFTNRRKFREMMPIVVAILMTTLAFFVGMISFVASPFQLLMAGKGVIDVGDGNGLSAAAVVDDGDSSADAVSRLRRIHGAVCVCDGIAGDQAAGRGMDSYDAALGDCDVAVSEHGRFARHVLGLHGARLGRLLGLGSGGKRVTEALDYGDRVSALGDDAGKKGNDEGLEHGAGLGYVPAEHTRNDIDANGAGLVGTCVRAVASKAVFHDIHPYGDGIDCICNYSQSAVFAQRSEAGKRCFARIEFSIQQSDSAGELLRGFVGHIVSGADGSDQR